MISYENASLYGLHPGVTEITEAEWLAFVHLNDRDRVFANSRDLLRRGGPPATGFRIRHADGASWPHGYQDKVAHGEGLSGQVHCLPSWPGVSQLSTPPP
jgi:PAS fold